MIYRTIFLLALALSFTSVGYGDDVPNWLRQAAACPVPSYERDVPAVVLYDEEVVTLGKDGKLVTIDNFAVKVLNDEGRRFATATAPYFVSSSKVTDIQAWLLRPDGTSRNFDKKMVVDAIADREDVYDEGRLKTISASRDAEPGSVFGYTVSSEEIPLFYQDQWSFQSELPELISRYTLNLPAGWSAHSFTFNSPDVVPVVNGTTYTWEKRNLRGIPKEILSPSIVNLASRIVVNYLPEDKTGLADHVFANWTEVSRWATSLHDPQVIVDDAVATKARDLTLNAKTELDKIRAIATFVQNLQYISIDIGLGHGNGYRPRPSNLVLGRGYGDCKDKANLMRALLRVLKIDAYPVAIFSGDPAFVREQWASPRQFNHCIIAVKVSDETKAPTVIQNEKLGRLLIFDATDPYTPVGDLPYHLQGSLALIAAGENGGLFHMPITPQDTDLLERNVAAVISDLGEVKGSIQERAFGQASTVYRRDNRNLSATEYRKTIEGWVTSGATGARVDDVKTGEGDNNSFNIDVAFSAQRYGQLMQNKLLVFKPVIVSRRHNTFLTEPTRVNPIEIDGRTIKETALFTLPDGFAIDELPDPVNLQAPFGTYWTKYEVIGNKLHFTRELKMSRMTLPVEKYAIAKDFFSKILEAELMPVVLIRK